MKYNYSKKSWNLDVESLGENKGNKRYLRYVIIALVVIIIALLIWLFSGSPSHKSKPKTTGPTATASKQAPAKAEQSDYTTIPLKLPSSSSSQES